MKQLILISIILISLMSCPSKQMEKENMTIELNKNWQFKQVDKTEWINAKVPGSVHMDLLANGLIEEPYYRLNEHDQQWIDKVDWEYKTNFDVTEELLDKDHLEMVFDGLDTYAEVFLNGKKVLSADNMFRVWEIDCKEELKPKGNELRIVFRSPINVGLEKLFKEKYEYPDPPNDLSEIGGIGDKKVSIFTRKAGYHFGWDWGPRLTTSGIWRPVKINGWNEAKLDHTFFRQVNLKQKQADLNAILEINADQVSDGEVKIRKGEKAIKTKAITLKKGNNEINVPFSIKNPKRWWPVGLGERHLYDLTAEVYMNGKLVDEKSHRIGLRDVEVVREKDDYGESFYFKVNGHPVFAKGANYIPQDVFLNQVTPDRYEHILQSAVDANMNMVRVWGGGIYENKIFYDLCDEKGLMVWQDFMFACSMYPGDKPFLDNVKQEAIDNVKRLRNHPSIVIWCGNNECVDAWYHWGWVDQVTENQGKEAADYMWNAYVNVYHKILPEAVKAYDNDRFYWSSSPCAGMGNPSQVDKGDLHYWGVWHGKEPFETFESYMPRFMSEYGFQSFPEFSTVDKYTEPEDYDIHSEVMKSHQRSGIGNTTIEEYMLRDYKKPKDFKSYLYVSHVLQAEGIGFGIEAHRRNRDRCMGTLYWQLNDCWPVASWSSIDYYGKWKALQYYAKKLFAPILISPHREDGKVNMHIVSDILEDQPATLKMTLMDFDGNVKWEDEKDVTITANTAKIYYDIDEKELLGKVSKNRSLLKAVVELPNGKVASQNIFYFDKPKNLNFDNATIDYSVEGGGKEFKIKLSSEKLAKNLYITVEDCDGFLSDNYFDLLPGEEVMVKLTTEKAINKDGLKLAFKTINEL